MSRYLQLGNDESEPLDLSSNSGWTQFHGWVDSLEGEQFSALREFIDDGSTGDAQKVREEISEALAVQPPIPDVQSIAETLVEHLDGETGSATIV